jgi:hypothetical protein
MDARHLSARPSKHCPVAAATAVRPTPSGTMVMLGAPSRPGRVDGGAGARSPARTTVNADRCGSLRLTQPEVPGGCMGLPARARQVSGPTMPSSMS